MSGRCVVVGLVNVIKFDGFKDRKWLIYRYPENDFNTQSKLIVNPGQVAIVVHGGKVERIFENGTHALDTENLPFLREMIKSVYSGESPYQMVVYFINRTIKLDMFFGTSDSIQMLDPEFKVMINLRARGQYGLRIKDYQFLFTQLIGSLSDYNIIEFKEVNVFFRSIINTKIKVILAQYLIKNKIGVLNMALYLEEISKSSHESLKSVFEQFGIELINFYYESIDIPDDDLQHINKILNKNAEFNIMGDQRYRTSRGYDVLDKAAKNEGGAGGLIGAGLGLGIGVQVAKESKILSSDIVPGENTDTEGTFKYCSKCGTKLISDAIFCSKCGNKVG